MGGQCPFFFSGSFIVSDAVVKVVVVALSALFAVAAADVELAFHDPRDLGPSLHLLVFVEIFEDAVLLNGTRGTISLQALRSLIPAI